METVKEPPKRPFRLQPDADDYVEIYRNLFVRRLQYLDGAERAECIHLLRQIGEHAETIKTLLRGRYGIR